MWRCDPYYVMNVNCIVNKNYHKKCHHVNLLSFGHALDVVGAKHMTGEHAPPSSNEIMTLLMIVFIGSTIHIYSIIMNTESH